VTKWISSCASKSGKPQGVVMDVGNSVSDVGSGNGATDGT
jgi:hypothetical protein